MYNQNMRRNKKIILAAVCLALRLVLSRFLSIKTPIVVISFGFIPTALAAIYLGWKWTVLINVLGDLVGALLFPTGPFFIGYTISAGLAGLIYGLLLFKPRSNAMSERQFILRAIIAVVLIAIIVNVGLNTFWISITAGKAFWPLLATRIVKELIMIPIQVSIIIVLEKVLRPTAQKYLYQESPTQHAQSQKS